MACSIPNVCKQEIHEGDTGTIFEATLKDCVCDIDGDEVISIVNVSAAIQKELIFLKPAPDLTKVVQTADFKTDGSDGIIQYISVAGDLNIVGLWKIQARIQLPNGDWKTSISKFKVFGNL